MAKADFVSYNMIEYVLYMHAHICVINLGSKIVFALLAFDILHPPPLLGLASISRIPFSCF